MGERCSHWFASVKLFGEMNTVKQGSPKSYRYLLIPVDTCCMAEVIPTSSQLHGKLLTIHTQQVHATHTHNVQMYAHTAHVYVHARARAHTHTHTHTHSTYTRAFTHSLTHIPTRMAVQYPSPSPHSARRKSPLFIQPYTFAPLHSHDHTRFPPPPHPTLCSLLTMFQSAQRGHPTASSGVKTISTSK